MSAIPPFDPEAFRQWLRSVAETKTCFEANVADLADLTKEDAFIRFWNAFIRCTMSLGEANERLGLGPSQSDLRQIIATRIEQIPRECETDMFDRLMNTVAAYSLNLRLPWSGSKDGRMQAATQVAAFIEGMEGPEPGETVRKSLQRYRKRIRQANFVQFDPETLLLESVNAEESFFAGLPGKPGKPKQ